MVFCNELQWSAMVMILEKNAMVYNGLQWSAMKYNEMQWYLYLHSSPLGGVMWSHDLMTSSVQVIASDC